MQQDYVISLTTIPPRFDRIAGTLDSLLQQSLPAQRVILYLPRHYRRFPEYDGHLPDVPDGVEIRVIDRDFGPATKVLPAVQEFAGQGVELLFCDDDMFYPSWMAARFLKARSAHPTSAVTLMGQMITSVLEDATPTPLRPHRVRLWRSADVPFQTHMLWRQLIARLGGPALIEPPRRTIIRSGYGDFFEGYGAVMLSPDFLPPECFDIPKFAWPVDDIWISGQLVRSGHSIWVLGGTHEPRPMAHHFETQSALHHTVIQGQDRGNSNRETARYFQKTYGIGC